MNLEECDLDQMYLVEAPEILDLVMHVRTERLECLASLQEVGRLFASL